jgi:hypothetical protein
MELFDAVARLKLGLVEFSYAVDQGGQTLVHQRFCLLSLDDQEEHKFVLPRRLDMHINQKPSLLRIFPATLEECQNILNPTVAAPR